MWWESAKLTVFPTVHNLFTVNNRSETLASIATKNLVEHTLAGKTWDFWVDVTFRACPEVFGVVTYVHARIDR